MLMVPGPWSGECTRGCPGTPEPVVPVKGQPFFFMLNVDLAKFCSFFKRMTKKTELRHEKLNFVWKKLSKYFENKQICIA